MSFSPVAVALDRLQGDCFYGVLVPTIIAVEKKLNGLLQMELKYCKPLVQALLDGIKKRFGDFLNQEKTDPVLAAVSHPYFKLRWVPTDKKDEVMENFLQIVCQMNELLTSADPGTDNSTEAKDDDFFGFENNPQQELAGSQNKIRLQCHQFLDDTRTDIQMLEQYPAIRFAS
jgi:hypothetical protein